MSRIAIVDKKKCHPEECNELCIKKCPINKGGDECMKIVEGKAWIDEVLCVGCGICPKVCPYKALDIINLPEALNDTAIHRYGENQFSLYNLPVPVFGKVVGLLGRNGIGKSTAMKILAGVLKPNFENYEKTSTYRDLIDYFKGTEAQAYFEKLAKNEITISYKPQQIELIPKNFDGKVSDLLHKVDEKNAFEEITSMLDLTPILDRDIKQVSGGELQRVTIAACVLKKANVYFFDEPTSYLDIKQRLKVAKFIRQLADENTAVIVIEHDLIILDYLTDFVHLVYGKESAYGIVSSLKATKNGINTYLSGYLREENVRFRDHEIMFETHPDENITSIHKLVEWKAFEQQLGDFTFGASNGIVYRNDVVGILGENGIGKTSLVKSLVGASKKENDIKLNVVETIPELKIAYKPQYIESSDEIVRLYLKDALKYDLQLIKPLSIEPLLDLQLNELSGGELQRVTIAKTLAEDAHLYFLDEPSAYLDVEQRLALSKVIATMMDVKRASALVVDHDLLFIDYISKRLLVFQGEPAIKGLATGPYGMAEGMNNFLDDLDITFRRDEANNRPRVNKPESQKDKEQKNSGKLYYG
ncbi:ribosome biogenesis/translation initiation ATPase RLI [Candidatus Woesearchaeota archaeon]|nr:ribosome biogenesis/translation initiation ATPase RLI [Candidatus Woesearchaeota archaeon]